MFSGSFSKIVRSVRLRELFDTNVDKSVKCTLITRYPVSTHTHKNETTFYLCQTFFHKTRGVFRKLFIFLEEGILISAYK